jgi:hypothetical protein
MCWCAGTFDCLRAGEFAVDLGELVIVGPARREARTCVSGQTCSIDTLTGSLLDDESAVVVLDTCGAATVVPRLPDGGHMTPRAGTRGLGLFYVRNAEEANRTYSSVFNNDVAGSGYARSVLGSEQAWSAGAGQANEWVQLDLGEFKFVRAVITQGRKQPPERILTVTDGHPNSYASAGEYFGFANAQADMVFGEISWDGQAFPARANNRTGTVILFRDNLNCGMSCGRWVEWLPLYTQEAAGVLDGNIRGEHDAPHRRRLPDSERTPYLQGAGDWSVADTINIYPRQNVDRGEWVTEFRVETSVDDTTFTNLGTFAGNRDRETAVRSPFPDVTFPLDWNEVADGSTSQPKRTHRIVASALERLPADVVARYVRIIPTTWHGYASLRADVEAYSAPSSMRAASSGTAGDSALGAAQAWIPAVAQQDEWVQVDLGTEKRVGAVVTQGRGDADEWVTLYRVEHSLDGVHFSTLGPYIANWTVNDAGTNANASFLSRTSPRTVIVIRWYALRGTPTLSRGTYASSLLLGTQRRRFGLMWKPWHRRELSASPSVPQS